MVICAVNLQKESILVRPEIIAARLERLKVYLNTLKAVKKFGLKRFKDDPFIHGAAERYLHLSIECLLDIGNHIIADRHCRKPETYSEIFEILAGEKIISTRLLGELNGLAAFRNLLVHDYLKLDRDKIYEIIQSKLKCFEKLAKIYSSFL